MLLTNNCIMLYRVFVNGYKGVFFIELAPELEFRAHFWDQSLVFTFYWEKQMQDWTLRLCFHLCNLPSTIHRARQKRWAPFSWLLGPTILPLKSEKKLGVKNCTQLPMHKKSTLVGSTDGSLLGGPRECIYLWIIPWLVIFYLRNNWVS
jgi:hypothetical protein